MVTGTVGTDVIVIDAGHGGFDGGAVSKDGTSEKDINLAIREAKFLSSLYQLKDTEKLFHLSEPLCHYFRKTCGH